MSRYTPDTNNIKYAFVDGNNPRSEEDHVSLMEGFDRWLNAQLAEAWDAGQQSGAQWGVSEWAEEETITSDNPYRKADS